MNTYNCRDSVVFFKTKEKYGWLSNMSPRYKPVVNGYTFYTLEHLYQILRFSNQPLIQELLFDIISPIALKKESRIYIENTRNDWLSVRVSIMRWCLKVKIACNYASIKNLFLSTGENIIVEKSFKDTFWGAIPSKNNQDILVGYNVLGRLLTELRDECVEDKKEAMKTVNPLTLQDFSLFGSSIKTINY